MLRLAFGVIEQPVVQRPDRRLRAIARSDLGQNGLHMRLDGRLRDAEEARDVLIGVALHDTFKDGDLARRQSLAGARLVRGFPGMLISDGRRDPLFSLWRDLQ